MSFWSHLISHSALTPHLDDDTHNGLAALEDNCIKTLVAGAPVTIPRMDQSEASIHINDQANIA